MAKYLKQDSELGYIEDSAEIEYLKLNNLRHSILGNMLGEFDEQGFYVIAPQIQKELISMRKFIVNSLDNIDICHGVLMLDKPITFMVTFESDRATLSLVEKMSYEANLEIDSGTYSNVNEFILDEVETAGEINRNLVYKRWNIGEYGGETLDVRHMDEETLAQFLGIVNRYKYLLCANKMLLKKEEALEDIEAEYTIGMFEVLSRYPQLKKLVDAEIKSEIKEKKRFILLDKANFAKTFNEVLDQAIDNGLFELSDEEQQAFKEERRSVLLKRNMKMGEELNIKTVATTEEERNVVENQEVFEEQSKKIVLDVPLENKPIEQLETEMDELEASTNDRLESKVSDYIKDREKRKTKAKLEDIEELYEEIDGVDGLEEHLGEGTKKKLTEIEKKKDVEFKVPPKADTHAPAVSPAAPKANSKAPARPAAGVKKPAAASPAKGGSKKADKEQAASPSAASSSPSGGYEYRERSESLLSEIPHRRFDGVKKKEPKEEPKPETDLEREKREITESLNALGRAIDSGEVKVNRAELNLAAEERAKAPVESEIRAGTSRGVSRRATRRVAQPELEEGRSVEPRRPEDTGGLGVGM